MHRLRLLLADEQQICLAGLWKLLEGEFEIVGAVQDGRALTRLASEKTPDVIVAELPMRFLDGPDAIVRLKEEAGGAEVVVLSAYADVWSARQALDGGASAYILKCDTPHCLIASIHGVSRGKSGILSPALMAKTEPQEHRKLGNLTPRQMEVLRLLSEGRTQKEIASIINVSVRTVEFHKYELMKRLHVRSGAELMAVAARHGFFNHQTSPG